MRSVYLKDDSLLEVARANYREEPGNLENIIWYGRRLAYLSEYAPAMTVYTHGLHIHPKSPELYRHRGHRYISIRQFDEAVNDLTMAARLARGRDVEIEPDGKPNKLNQPLSSLQFNIWYHLALTHYLQGHYDQAAIAYDSCLQYSTNNDLLCATSYWYYLTGMNHGETIRAQALLTPVTRRIKLIENEGYHQLLLMYKGIIQREEVLSLDTSRVANEHIFATLGYGVGKHLMHQGRAAEALAIFHRILRTEAWASFGYIATEADKALGNWQ